jgi:hypothetical protein
MVMEKIIPVNLIEYTSTPSGKQNIKFLFEKLFRNGIVNLDGGFGVRINTNELLMYDYGVSYLLDDDDDDKDDDDKDDNFPEKTIKEYIKEDYFLNFPDIFGIDITTIL